ncbi:MCE family protein [Mycolicibacterium vinylchloridicum]|uniref:MCE family protein n=1 Tax=Mycolicibacterium vinylchloridicum TaxID=2736928 RepID=UPI0015CBF37A|nr:MCE family protein [Mycolicibacterium vinylchloridicum]
MVTDGIFRRAVVGFVGVLVLIGIVVVAATQFAGGFTPSAQVILMAPRAGLVMNPDAQVRLLGVQVGTVKSIEDLPDGRAAIHLAMDPDKLSAIPSNVAAEISASTVFGAKNVQLIPPANPSTASMTPGQVLDAQHVTVEVNTVFTQLTSVLSKIDPAKLNQTLAAVSAAFNGRGEQLGQSLSDLNHYLGAVEPHLPALAGDLDVLPTAVAAYADSAQDVVNILDSTSSISDTIVDQQGQLDTALMSLIGLADAGNDVVGSNADALTRVLHLLVPTSDLLRGYSPALWCGLAGLTVLANQPALKDPGLPVLSGLLWSLDRYRYPSDMPKVAASGGPQCTGLPKLPYQTVPPFVVTDTGTNPWKYGNPGLVLNSDGIKRLLFGDIDGPPRNSAQIGQPG